MNFDIIRPSKLEELLHNYEDRGIQYELIDVREKEEFDKGHWPKAMNLPYEEADFYRYAHRFPVAKNKRIILYCSHGANSMQLARELSREGYRVSTVNGGYAVLQNYLPKNK